MKATETYLILCQMDAGEITLQEAHELILRLFDVSGSLPNGKRVLAALKELSDCFTDEERKTMFGNEA
jgi:hypothetical protein